MGRYDRVGVGVFGQLEMVRDTRMAVAASNGNWAGNTPVVELHVETYEW